MSFNLFGAEEAAIEQGRRLREKLGAVEPEVRAEVEQLLDAFERGYREQRRLVRVSDRLQAQLASVNQELERRRQEAETTLDRLREAQDELVRSERLASLGSLVAGVAHEINTPVGIAVSCASHLADATGKLREQVGRGDLGRAEFTRYLMTANDTSALILANCERAAQLINSFKQVAVDRASSERRRFRLGAYIREVLVSVQPKLRQTNHDVTVDCPADLEVDSFPGALSQILTNLVMNSIAHGYEEGEAGTLTVTVTRPDPATVRLVYADDGRGIPAEHRALVFEPFFTTRRGEGGSGLGLHIVHNLAVGPLRGSIALDGERERGAAFVITFPKDAPPKDASAPDASDGIITGN